jgi:DNA-binding GntR family transcriptional regulator
VTAIDVGHQLQILETRRELDRLIARSAAARATLTERATMTAIAQRMEAAVKSDDFVVFLRCDYDMNRQSALSARNNVAAAAVAALHSASRRFWFYHHQGRANTTLRLHVALARAMASGKPEKAAEASDRLIDDLFDFAHGTLITRT